MGSKKRVIASCFVNVTWLSASLTRLSYDDSVICGSCQEKKKGEEKKHEKKRNKYTRGEMMARNEENR